MIMQYTIPIVQEKLLALQDLDYQKFHSSLVPGINNVIGVRIPILRQLAKEMLRGDWQAYLDTALPQTSTYYEENILQALLIGTSKLLWQERHMYIKAFVPKIDNWGVCDIFCSTLKDARTHPQEYWQLLTPYLASDKAYDLRFGAVMLLNYFTDQPYTQVSLDLLHKIQHDDYYVKMGVAWALSIFYIKQPQLTLPLLHDNHLDTFTHNKAIQKICESFRVSQAEKEMLKSLRK